MNPSSRELHGLVFLNSTDSPLAGMNRSIVAARDGLRDAGIHLEFFVPRTVTQTVKSFRRLLQHGRVFDYDFTFFNSVASLHTTSRCGYPMARLFSRGKTRPFIYWHEMASVLERCAEEDPWKRARFDRFAKSPRVTHLVASEATGRDIAARYPLAVPHVIYECIPDEREATPDPPAAPPIVLTVASVQERKGFDLFIETAKRVCAQHPDAVMWWVGAGPELARAREDVRARGLDRRVHFFGYIDSPAPLMRRASVVFLPSREDPFPLAVLEAMASARHVVTFESGGATEAVADHGDIIANFDTEAAASAILQRLALSPDQRPNTALQARFETMYTKAHFVERLAHVLRAGVEGSLQALRQP